MDPNKTKPMMKNLDMKNRYLSEIEILQILKHLTDTETINLSDNFNIDMDKEIAVVSTFLVYDELDNNYNIMEIILPICSSPALQIYCQSIVKRNRALANYENRKLKATIEMRKEEIFKITQNLNVNVNNIYEVINWYKSESRGKSPVELTQHTKTLQTRIQNFLTRLETFQLLLRNVQAYVNNVRAMNSFSQTIYDELSRCIDIESRMSSFSSDCDTYFKRCAIYKCNPVPTTIKEYSRWNTRT